MKRTYVFGTMMALALTGSVYAQQSADQSAASATQKDREVTVTGCLVPAAPTPATTAGTAGTAGSTSSTASASKFMLANASISGGSGSTASTGTSGTSGTTGATGSSTASGASYNLIGGDSSDLDKNLNSKVEIRGVIEPSSASSPSSAAGGTMTGGTSGAASPAAKQLRVTSVRQLASTCGGGQ